MGTMHQGESDRMRDDRTGEVVVGYNEENMCTPPISQSLSFAKVGSFADGFMEQRSWEKKEDARPLLPRAAFFIGDLRDGLPMLNMQAVFLISSKNYSEKQIGVLFLAFGLSQFFCMTPAGYLLDYSNRKIDWVNWSGIITSLLTVATIVTAGEAGSNMAFMILLKILQGGASAVLPPGFNSVTLGIVGSTGFTVQVAKNRTMNHIGTALVIVVGSSIAYFLYPNIGALFIVSPLTMVGVYYNMVRIKPNHVDRDAARALIIESPTMTEYEHLDTQNTSDSNIHGIIYEGGEYVEAPMTSSSDSSNDDASYNPPHQSSMNAVIQNTKSHEIMQAGSTNSLRHQDSSNSSIPSFRLGWPGGERNTNAHQPRTPLAVLLDPTLILFTVIVFCFHMANSSVLPLVMQSLAVEDDKSGILLSGMCIFIGQAFMSYFAKICGDYSPKWGRKGLILVALSSLTVRCFCLTILMTAKNEVNTQIGLMIFKALIISTQLLDSIGAGIFGTMHILVTNDISSRSGRFSLMMGVTSSAMCLGATVSGYIGQSIAQDYGYPMAFTSLGALSLVPLLLYAFCMSETLPDYVHDLKRKRRISAILERLNDKRRKLFRRNKQQKNVIALKTQEGIVTSPDDGDENNAPKLELV